MKSNISRQYTVRSVTTQVDRELKKKAKNLGVSLNSLILKALEKEAGITSNPPTHNDLDSFFGSWREEKAVDKALIDQRKVNKKDWE
jgi:hypothetical protein